MAHIRALSEPVVLKEIIKSLATLENGRSYLLPAVLVNQTWFALAAEYLWAEAPERAVVYLVPAARNRDPIRVRKP